MRWKFLPFIMLGCCLAAGAIARPQSAWRGLSVIVVPTESNAVELRSRIESGSSFEALATLYSTHSTAVRCGYMGMVNEAGLRQEFKAALKEMKAGRVSAVTRLGDGFALLKWTTADEDRWRSEHDMALTALQQARYPEAVSGFLVAVRQGEILGAEDIRLAESLNGLAQAYRYQRNYADAEGPARRSLAIVERALGPSHTGILPSLLNLAGVVRATGRNAEAEQVYRRIVSIRWGTPGATSVSVNQVLEKFSEVLTLAYTRDPRLESGLREYLRLIAESRLDKNLYIGMNDGLMAVSRLTEAEALLQSAIRLYPDSRQLHYQLGELYATWEKHEKAIAAFKDAARAGVHPDPEEERRRRGRLYERIAEMNFFLVRFDDAFAALTIALETNPASVKPRLLLGALYLRRNRFDDAAAEYSRVIAGNPGNADAYDGLAQVALALGRFAETVQHADRALAINPGFQTSRYAKAMALIRAGRSDEGRLALQEYQQRESEQQAANSRLNELAELDRASSGLLAEGRLQEAMESVRKGLLSHPIAAVLYLKLGLTQSRLQLHREAADTFETMVRLNLDDFLVHWQLAREYEALGDRENSQMQRVIYLQRYDAAMMSIVQ
jgi:tetratricopeptide (TPR) repeat protein